MRLLFLEGLADHLEPKTGFHAVDLWPRRQQVFVVSSEEIDNSVLTVIQQLIILLLTSIQLLNALISWQEFGKY